LAVLLVLDIGSSSVRSSLWDERAEPVDEAAKLPYQRRTAPDGTAQVDADALLDLTAQAIDAALEGGHEVSAVAMSTMWHCLLGLDTEGRPATPVYTWADRRAAHAAARLRERLDERAVHARTGCPLHSSYWPAKLAWLHGASPEATRRVRTWVSPGEYVHRRLFGDAPVSTSMASATGLLDQHQCRWDPELASAVGAAGALPEIDDAPLRGLREEWARRWPSLRDVPWFPPVGDGACSNVGTGCVTHDRAALMVGTSGALRVMWAVDDVRIPPGLWCYRADARRVVMGGALSDGGSVVAWLRRLTRLPPEEETEREIAAMEPDAHGLTVLPLLSGERGPGWADEASATIAGLSLATDPLQLLRASLEAVALRFALIDELLKEALPEERHVIATGGGLVASPAWTQIMADALGRPVTASAVEEGSSRGAALLALEALGTIDSLEAVEVPLGETFEPDPRHTAAYKRALARQRELYEATIEIMR
jgi:gluconokinase